MIDTNILLDWLLDRIPAHTKLVDNLLTHSKELHIPDVAIVELAFALEKHYELPRDIVCSNIIKVLDEPVFNCNRALFQQATVKYGQHPALSFVDCCLLYYADLQDVTVWTFYKKFANQSAGKACLL